MIKQRISQLLDYKQIAKEKFYERIGMTSANFRGSAQNRPINSNAIENIFSEIPDLNLEWLLTGRGPMIKTPTATTEHGLRELEKEIIELQREVIRLQKENAKLKEYKSIQPVHAPERTTELKE